MAFNFRHHIPQTHDVTVGAGVVNPPSVASTSLINAEVGDEVNVRGYVYSPGDKILVKEKEDSKQDYVAKIVTIYPRVRLVLVDWEWPGFPRSLVRNNWIHPASDTMVRFLV